MAHETLVVTAADPSFMDVTRGLLSSLKDHNPDVPIALLDLGLNSDHLAELKTSGVHTVIPNWHASKEFLAHYAPAPWYRAMTARPYIPEYFPGYDNYLWLDGDTWVTSSSGLSTLVQTAQTRSIAIASTADRSYQRFHGQDVVRGRSAMISILAHTVPEKTAQMMSFGAEYCSGVFAMCHSSPIWRLWAEALHECMEHMLAEKKPLTHIFEQIALNLVLYKQPMDQLGLLPARYDWIVGEALPLLDLEHGLLREPQPPYDPIEIVHLIHLGRALEKLGQVVLKTTCGRQIHTSLGYNALRSLLTFPS